MDKKQILTRVSRETYDRLQGLSEKYGMSASAVIVSLINERWIVENSTVNKADLEYLAKHVSDPEIGFKPEVKPESSASSRKRHKSKR